MPSVVGTCTGTGPTIAPYQRKCFFAKGRFWVFYQVALKGNIVYKTSTDGVNWTDSTIIGRSVPDAEGFSLYYDGIYLHYSRTDESLSPYSLYYRRGTPEADGTITWSADEQVVYAGASDDWHSHPFVAVDSEGYPWIVADHVGGPTNVFKSLWNDGTWETDPDFPYGVGFSGVTILPLTSKKMYFTCTTKGRLWNGSSFEPIETFSSNPYLDWNYGAVADQNDDIHVVFTKGYPTYDVVYLRRRFGIGWDSEVIVQKHVALIIGVSLSIDVNTNNLYCFMAGIQANHIHYKRYMAGAWETTAKDWIDESAEELSGTFRLTSFYQSNDNRIGLTYMTKKSSPYNVKFAFLTVKRVQYADGLFCVDAISVE